MKYALWVVQALLALAFVGAALMKLVTPIVVVGLGAPIVLGALSVFVAWGRWSREPVAARGAVAEVS